MYLVVFRNLKRADIDVAAYGHEALEMETLAASQPGYVSFKSYQAEDGEVVALSEWTDKTAARAWGRVAEHVEAMRHGREAYYESYTLYACAAPEIRSFRRDQ